MMKQSFMKYQMIDFMEFTMRKVVSKNMTFCADQCKMFDNILDEDLSTKEERIQNNCFENCIGKHSDSVEYGLD